LVEHALGQRGLNTEDEEEVERGSEKEDPNSWIPGTKILSYA
jgi:hypothetical protein